MILHNVHQHIIEPVHVSMEVHKHTTGRGRIDVDAMPLRHAAERKIGKTHTLIITLTFTLTPHTLTR